MQFLSKRCMVNEGQGKTGHSTFIQSKEVHDLYKTFATQFLYEVFEPFFKLNDVRCGLNMCLLRKSLIFSQYFVLSGQWLSTPSPFILTSNILKLRKEKQIFIYFF